MRTKNLLLSAAALVAGALSVQAQSNVYSVNVVGYVNQPFVAGYQLITDQLAYDGSLTNNTLDNIFGTNSVPNGVVVYKWNGSGYSSTTFNSALHRWIPSGSVTINPGEAAFVKYPSSATNTFVGTVIQGTNSYSYPAGFSTIAFKAPVAGTIKTNLNFSPQNGDVVYTFNTGSQTYSSATWNSALNRFIPSEPNLSVGQGVFLKAAGASSWSQVLNVQ